MTKTKDELVAEMANFGRKIFEISSIIETKPEHLCAGLAVALGMACGMFNFKPEELNDVINSYAGKMKEVQEELTSMIKKEKDFEEILFPKKSDGGSN